MAFTSSPTIPEASWTKITIQQAANDVIFHGDEFTLSCAIEIDDRIIPDGANVTQDYLWTDHNNVSIGSGSTTSYFPEDGWIAVSVKVVIEDTSIGFLYEFSSDYSFYVTPLESINHTFGLQYTESTGAPSHCNMDIMKFLTYFPSWSSAHKNHYSNTSKFLSPHFERFGFELDRADTFSANNNTSQYRASYEYRTEDHTFLAVNTPKLIRTEFGICRHMGEMSSMSVDSIPVTDLSLVPCKKISKMSTDLMQGVNDIQMTHPSYMYLKRDSEQGSQPTILDIGGINEDGEFIWEKIVLDNSIPIKTINRYYNITGCSSFEGQVRISNFIKEDHSYTDPVLMEKRISSRGGIYFSPKFEIEGRKLVVLNSDDQMHQEEYVFLLPFIPDEMIVSNLLDVFMLKDGEVWCSKLFLDYQNLSQFDSTTNNNEFICLDSETPEAGQVARLRISTGLAREEYPGSLIRVRVEHEDKTLYLSKSGTFVPEKNTWISLDETHRSLEIDYPIIKDEIIKYRLDISGRVGSFSAMSYQNKLDFTILTKGIAEIMVHDDRLIMVDSEGNHKDAFIVRRGYLSSGTICHTHYPFKEVELLSQEY